LKITTTNNGPQREVCGYEQLTGDDAGTMFLDSDGDTVLVCWGPHAIELQMLWINGDGFLHVVDEGIPSWPLRRAPAGTTVTITQE
jgi:hypothetical protein